MPLCNSCGKHLPVVDYFTLRQCIHCGHRRRLRYGLVALASIGLVCWIQFYPARLDFGLAWLVLVVFGIITVIDIEYRVVLFETVIVGGVIFAAIGVARHGVVSTLLGGAVGFLSMLSLYWLGKLLVRMRRQASSLNEEALGFGDVNLLAILGLLLGLPAVLVALWIAIFAAGIFSVGLVLRMWLSRRYQANLTIPYAPFLVLGAFTLLYLVRP